MTPGIARATASSIVRILPAAIVDVIATACRNPGIGHSAAKVAAPVTLSRPEERTTEAPTGRSSWMGSNMAFRIR